MATVKQQVKLIIEHPFFKESLNKMNAGDSSGFERLLMETMLHVWEKVALDASRVYGQYRRANSCDIKREIRDMPPPVGLDLRLPFVSKQVKKVKKIEVQVTFVKNQLKMF